MANGTETVELTPREIVWALTGIVEWLNAVREAVERLPADTRVRIPRNRLAPPMIEHCQPPIKIDPVGPRAGGTQTDVAKKPTAGGDKG
jgi:hypothetical protein